MKPWFLTGFSIALTVAATVQAVPVPTGQQQLKPYQPGYAAALADSVAPPPAALGSEPSQPFPNGYQVKMPVVQAEPTVPPSRFIQQIDANTQLQCREQNHQLDQCMVLPSDQARQQQTLTAVAPPAADRIAVADLVLPDAQLKACIVQVAQQYNVNFADELLWLDCYHNNQQPAITDLTGLSQLPNLQRVYIGAASAASNTLTGLDELLQLTKLTSLTFERYRLSSLDFLTDMPLLTTLGLHRLKVDAGWNVLAQLDHILALNHSTDASSDTPDIVPLINQMAGLTYIFVNTAQHQNLAGLSHPGITNVFVYQVTDLSFAAGVPALAYLNVYQNTLSDLNMSAMQNNQTLVSLSLNSVQLDNADTQVIQSLNRLSHLTIEESTNLASLAFVSQLNSLQNLSLPHTVNDTNFATFTLPEQLVYLNLSRSEWQQNDGTILKSINKLIQNPKNLTQLILTGQKYLPCAEIAQISAKITTVVAPASCGDTATKLSEVSIPDPALYQCIASENREYLEDITRLTCGFVRTLTGLQHLKNLTALYLYGNNTEQTLTGDITPIEQLTKLKSLTLASQKLTDSKIALQYPASLTSLNLGVNQLTQAAVSSLQTVLPQLNELTLNNNSFSSFNWLANASNLRFLTIGANPVTDLTFISQLPQLTYLSMQSLQLKDLTAFTMPANINNLDVSRNQLTSLAAVTDRLANPHLLASLSADDMSLSDLSQLKLLPDLSYLSLNGNKVATSYAEIGSLQKLSWLNLQEAVLPLKFPDFVVPASVQNLYMSMNNSNKARVQDISEIVRAASQFRSLQLTGQVAIDCTQVNTLKNHANSAAFWLPNQCGQLLVNESTVPDPVLRQCLLNSGNTMLQNITFISCTGNVSNWQGVRHMLQLLSVNSIGSETAEKAVQGLAEFNNLPMLGTLLLHNQGITDASLATLANNKVSYLALRGNPITQASFATLGSAFSNLNFVDLSSTKISALTHIAQLNVQAINLRDNPFISSYAALSQLGNKTTNLEISSDNAALLTGLKFPAQLTAASFRGKAFSSISDTLALFTQPANLQYLNISSSNLASLAGLTSAINLQALHMWDQHNPALTDFSLIGQLPKLMDLGVNHVNLTSLTPIQSLLPQLTNLDISNTSVADLRPLTAMTKATFLALSDLPAVDYSPLHTLTTLRYIWLAGNTNMYCSELDLLKQKLPAAYVDAPPICFDSTSKGFKTPVGTAISSVLLVDQADSRLGTLSIVNGQIMFVPASGVSGRISFAITYQVGNSSFTTTLTIWVTPTESPANKRKGLPWWVIAVPKAA